jgi:hypothetical protein
LGKELDIVRNLCLRGTGIKKPTVSKDLNDVYTKGSLFHRTKIERSRNGIPKRFQRRISALREVDNTVTGVTVRTSNKLCAKKNKLRK